MIVSIDVGKGTEDVMIIFEEDNTFENSIQIVYPSTAQLLYKKLRADKSSKILISGDIIAGEPWHKEVYKLCKIKPQKVIMTETAAMSLRYNLNHVKAKGVKIVPDNEISDFGEINYNLSDIIWDRIFSVIEYSGLHRDQISKILIGCQDHGKPENPNQSARDFRMRAIYTSLNDEGEFQDLLLQSDKIPKYLPRHRSIANSALNHNAHLVKKDVFVMDSSPAVILGTMKGLPNELIVNVGNGHTLAAFIENGKVNSIFETHTGAVNSLNLLADLKRLAEREITHEQALAQGAHGIFIRKGEEDRKLNYIDFNPMRVIGPNRSKLHDLKPDFPHPGGNMMMAGPIGMILALKHKEK